MEVQMTQTRKAVICTTILCGKSISRRHSAEYNRITGDFHSNTLRKMCVTVHKPHIKTDQPPMPSGKSFNLGQDADKAEI